MKQARRIQHAIVSGFVQVVVEDRFLPAFWAHPQLSATFPGLILIHDAYGLTSHMRACVRRLAEVGFYVIAPDLYDGAQATSADQAATLAAGLGATGIPRVSAALRALRTHNHCNGKVGVVGWQMGGELTFQIMMMTTNIRAAVIFYARPDDYLPMLAVEEAPMLCIYGDSDPQIPKAMLDRVEAALTKSPGKGQVVVYPNTESGFFNNLLPAYNSEHAADALDKLIVFLSDHLDVPRNRPSQAHV